MIDVLSLQENWFFIVAFAYLLLVIMMAVCLFRLEAPVSKKPSAVIESDKNLLFEE